MDKEIKELEERLQRVNLIISKLDPAIKQVAFDLLKPFVLNNTIEKIISPDEKAAEKKIQQNSFKGDVRDFYASFNPTKPADSALVLAGWFYTQQGSSAFSLEELYKLFDEVGVPRPNRVNMTLRSCSRKGKNLFTPAGHGKFRPNVHGENHFKSEMNLRPGKQA